MTEYTIIIEDAGSNFEVYAPDVPGCVAAGKTAEETLRLMKPWLCTSGCFVRWASRFPRPTFEPPWSKLLRKRLGP